MPMPIELAYPNPPALTHGVVRQYPADFVVHEQLRLWPSGSGGHVWLHVRKHGLTTVEVARRIAHAAGVRLREVGYAGLKDRHAVVEQWFSVPASPTADGRWQTLGDGVEVLDSVRHGQKLRKGALAGNVFAIVVREVQGSREQLEDALKRLRREGFPNYFGEQRFGFDAANIERTRDMFTGSRRVRDRFLRGLYLSSARAHIFNRVLAARVQTGCWCSILPGDALMLSGTRSFFVVDGLDDELRRRLEVGDLHPSGPLWGAGDVSTRAEVRALEERVAAEETVLRDGLAAAGLAPGRRPLRAIPQALEAQWVDAQTLRFCFSLSPGSYATVCMRSLVSYRDAARASSDACGLRAADTDQFADARYKA